MSGEQLTALRAERDQLEAKGDYGSAAYEYLVGRIDELERAEPASAPAPAPSGERASEASQATSASDRIAALARDLANAEADPGRLSDEERHALVERYNAEVQRVTSAAVEQDQDGTREDVAALAILMRDTAARADVDPAQAAELTARYQQALGQQDPRDRSEGELRGLLAGTDVQDRFEAAAELRRRGLLDDATADGMIGWLNQQVGAATEAAAEHGQLDLERIPEGPVRSLAGDLQRQLLEAEANPYGQTRTPLEQVNALITKASEARRAEQLALVGRPPPSPQRAHHPRRHEDGQRQRTTDRPAPTRAQPGPTQARLEPRPQERARHAPGRRGRPHRRP